MLIGYACATHADHELAGQLAALKRTDCVRIFREKASRSPGTRPTLGKLLAKIRPGDILIVTRLDRLARSTRDLLAILDRLVTVRAGFRSLAEPWADTTAQTGRNFLTIAAGMAAFERALIAERTAAGRRRAKRQGVRFGPKPKLSAKQIARARALLGDGQSVRIVAARLKCHRATLYRALAG